MVVICEECGKSYRIDPSKMKGKKGSATCKACGNVITIKPPNHEENVAFDSLEEIDDSAYAAAGNGNMATDQSTQPQKEIASAVIEPAKKKGLRLRTKIFLLFFLVPVALFTGSGLLFIDQLTQLSTLISNKGQKVVTSMAESIISEKAYAVAREVSLYLKTHPALTKENFATDKEFMEIAVQKVGKTGYTLVNSAPAENASWIIRAHPKPALVGAEILGAIKSRLSQEDYNRFKKLHDIAESTHQLSAGYYRFLDDEEKYLAMVPVAGTNLWVISTTYITEFTTPMRELQDEAKLITSSTTRITISILGVAILLVALISFIYGLRLSRNIKQLTDVTNRFSVGDMSASINLKAKDEIGELAEAINRMQTSIIWALDRLRKKNNR